jgi:hypothetical protein
VDNVKRIIREDFNEDYRDLIDKLSYILNTHMEQVVQQINGNLDFSNLRQEVIQVKYKVNSSGTPLINKTIKSNLKRPKGSLVISAFNQDNSAVFPTSAPFITFTASGQIITVKNISGLQANVEYLLNILIFDSV